MKTVQPPSSRPFPSFTTLTSIRLLLPFPHFLPVLVPLAQDILHVSHTRRHLALGLPERSPLAQDLPAPGLHLAQADAAGDVDELAEVDGAVAAALVLDHLQQQLELVDVVHEAGFGGGVGFVFGPGGGDEGAWVVVFGV
ncbi:MAG: hypothetical protein Q9193_000357 [Seirophora villosa]